MTVERDAFFFRQGEGQLYGVLHTARERNPRLGVVLCAPFAPEAIRTHRCFVQLADRLARSGVPTLRFDYSGTGDSAGDDGTGSLSAWTDDIRVAVREIKRRAGVRQVALVGLRLGATLAIGAAQNVRPDCLVLWNPVMDGAEYLREIDRVQNDMLIDIYVTNAPKTVRDSELLGFQLPAALRAEFDAIKIDFDNPEPETLVIETAAETDTYRSDTSSGNPVFRALKGSQIWFEGVEQSLVPQNVMKEIETWLTDRAR